MNELERAIDDWKHEKYGTCFPIIKRYAEAGDPEAQFILASASSNEFWGLKEDFPAAASWLRKAYSNGHPHAALHLALMLDPDNSLVNGKLQQDAEEAAIFYRIAFNEYVRRAAQGNYEFMYSLSNCYACGRGTDVNLKEADKLHSLLRKVGYNPYSNKCDL
jgi:TPR repeat protein